MRQLGFKTDSRTKQDYLSKGGVLIKRMLKNIKQKETPPQQHPFVARIASADLGNDAFCLSDMFDVAVGFTNQTDSFDKYMNRESSVNVLKKLRPAEEKGHSEQLI
ncbi:hypothetical protein FGB62_41g23 [Gracilaria domingensis]|nr:hypothetical protein FGB62_41g23 [Gracilaria domingensis]